jgi:hypothetical protein
MKKFLIGLLVVCCLVFSMPAFAGQPQGATGAIPTTMIGPLNATKTTLVDTSGGYSVGAILAVNASAAVAFVEFWDQPCANVTLGTTLPSWVVPVKANDWSFVLFPNMMWFSTPICTVSVTAPNGTVGSAAGVYMQVFIP